MDNKVKLEIKTPANKIISYNGVDIEIIPFINFAEEVVLINNYIKDYFGDLQEIVIPETKHHIFEAECRLINYIIQLNTNIDIDDIDNNIYTEGVLWSIITKEIVNYKLFRERLNYVVEQLRQEETLKYSIGSVVSDLINKADEAIDKLLSMNPDEIKKMGDTGLELIDRLEKSTVLRNPNDLAEIAKPLIGEESK